MDEPSGRLHEGDQLDGRYANYFEVGYNAFEVILDFGQLYSDTGKAQVHTRIITSPRYAKDLLDTLKRSLEQYEQAFGAIPKND